MAAISIGPTARAERVVERRMIVTSPNGTRLELRETERSTNMGSPLSTGAWDFLTSAATVVGAWFGFGL